MTARRWVGSDRVAFATYNVVVLQFYSRVTMYRHTAEFDSGWAGKERRQTAGELGEVIRVSLLLNGL